MGLETATYISGLNSSNPVHATDQVGEGDDHIRLIKSTLLNTFPNITGAMTASHTELNLLDGVASKTGTGALVLADAPTMTLDASMLTTGSLVDARVAESNVTQHVSAIDHDALLNFVADEHIAHSGVSITAGSGLTGGGAIDATMTIDVGAGTGIAVNANDVAVDVTAAFTWSGNHTFQERVRMNDEIEFNGHITASISGTESDFAPAGITTCNILRITSATATPILGGLAAGQADGRVILIYNDSGSGFTIDDLDAGSAAANRFETTGTGRTILDKQGVLIWYDGTSSRWRLLDLS